jgi:hypothetical protein
VGVQDAADRGLCCGSEVEGASGDVQLAVGVVAAHDQHLGCVHGPEDAADHGLAGEAGAEFLPAAHPGPVGLVEPFRDDALDS